jgi:hypothetical protein
MHDASFLLVTVLTALGMLLSLGLPKLLVTRTLGKDADDTEGGVSNIRVQDGHGSERITGAHIPRIGRNPVARAGNY